MMSSKPNPFGDLEYFNKTDAKDITWAHAVNSKDKLNKFMKTDILMFEADVLMRYNRNDTEPIMAHPPDNDSDLTLNTFLMSLKPTRKGIKLDFKAIMAVEPAMRILKQAYSSTDKPLWLNADILVGPGSNSQSNPPVDATDFITTCTGTYPNATLSLGWTTEWHKGITNKGYTRAMVQEMETICRNTTQIITFPIRAIYVRQSWEPLKWLLDTSSRYTLTIWSSVNDDVKVEDLVWLTKQIDKRRLYLDLPPELDDAFRKALESDESKGTSISTLSFTACLMFSSFVSFILKFQF
ncbi:protein FAM151B-like isoform X2 [Dendronephthya gigantea]|nr:protein FAM151B-like isoform X2 [Dendronephthya gigantea]